MTDQEVIDDFRKTRNESETARNFGVTRQTIHTRLMRLRLKGIELPLPKRGNPNFKKRDNEQSH